MSRPQLLFLSHRIPYPPNKGDKIRSWNVLRHLAKKFDIHLGAFIDDPEDRQHVGMLEDVCASTCFIMRGSGARALRLPGAWNSTLPLSVALWRNKGMARYVEEKMNGGVEHAYIFSGQMAPYILRYVSQKLTVVMDFVDVDSDKFRQYADRAHWPVSRVYKREAGRLHQFEKQIARAVDASLFVSEEEAALFRRHAGSYAHTVYALENGVDLDYFAPQPEPEGAGPARLVFTGAMDYRPNVEAADWMVQSVLRKVQDEVPGTEFTIVGANPGAGVRRLGGRTGVTVTGRVDDVRPYLAAADVAVAPIRTARGIQNKVLEAMAMGKAVVSTTAAYSGIDARPEEELVVRDDADGFAEAIVSLLKDDARRQQLGRAARARMVERYSWASRLEVLDGILARHRQPGAVGVAA